MKHFYHIKCDPDLEKSFCSMRHILCSCTGYAEQPSNPWLPNLDKNLQPRYIIGHKICNYYSILRGYNKWYISKLIIKNKQQTQTRWRLKTSLSWTVWLVKQKKRLNKIPLVNFKLATVTRLDIIYIWICNAYNIQEQYKCHVFGPPVIIPKDELVCPAKFMTPMRKNSYSYHETDEAIPVTVKLKQVVMPYI